jgi:hypothetical protein
VWWDAFAHTWSAEQRAHAWEALDKVRFFEVIEEHSKRKAYVVVEINWTWNDEPAIDADYEGGNVVRAFRSRANAEAECERLNQERRRQNAHQGYSYFDMNGRRGHAREQYSINEGIFFEVVAIELEGEA